MAFLVAFAIFWCFEPSHFPISSVKFIGKAKYISHQELQSLVLPQLKMGLVRLKVSRVQQQLLSLPWMSQVDIRKVWPNGLDIRFQEHVPAAHWGKLGLLSTNGTLFYPPHLVELINLPVLEGPEGKSSQVWQQYVIMKKILSPLQLHITHLMLAPRGAWHLRLSNGITVILGTNDILERLNHFVRLYPKHLLSLSEKMAYVDLRYTNGMAIGWRAG